MGDGNLDNEVRNYVDGQFEKALNITKGRIEDCLTGKLLNDRLHNFERRLRDMDVNIKQVATEAAAGIKTVGDQAQQAIKTATEEKLSSANKKNKKSFEIIMGLSNLVILLVLVALNIK